LDFGGTDFNLIALNVREGFAEKPRGYFFETKIRYNAVANTSNKLLIVRGIIRVYVFTRAIEIRKCDRFYFDHCAFGGVRFRTAV